MSETPKSTAEKLRAAFEVQDPERLAPLLHPAVRWTLLADECMPRTLINSALLERD